MSTRILGLVAVASLAAASAMGAGANGPPLASEWNIAPTGSATSSGALIFRITPNDGSNPVSITVPVIVGARQETVARGIRNSLSSQLPAHRFDVELGAGTNVLVRDQHGQPNFSLELVDSDVESLRVSVQSVTAAAPPTVPQQSAPAAPENLPPPPDSAPGSVMPPPNPSTPIPTPAPVPDNGTPPTSAPPPNPATPPASTPEASPPTPAPPATPPMSAPPPPT